jgi:hypothetical protein
MNQKYLVYISDMNWYLQTDIYLILNMDFKSIKLLYLYDNNL